MDEMEFMERLPWLIVYTMISYLNGSYMPCIGSCFCLLAFVICFILTKTLNHIPSWFIFPPISFLGYQMPERVFYAVLFTSGAICFLISFLYIQHYSFQKHGLYWWFVIPIRVTDLFSSKWLYSATILILIAPLFLTIQAVIPLQKDILDVYALIIRYVGKCERKCVEYHSSGSNQLMNPL